jgi:hypothetical protein
MYMYCDNASLPSKKKQESCTRDQESERQPAKNASTAGELAGSSQPIAAEEFLAIESQP